MANIAGLIGSGTTSALANLGAQELAQAATRSSIPVISQAIAPTATKIISSAAAPEIATSISQLLPIKSGSAIDGVINANTGISLPNAAPKTFRDYVGSSDLANALAEGNIDVDDINTLLPVKDANSLRSGVAKTAADFSPSNVGTTGSALNKTALPKIKTSDYRTATGLSGKDVPSYMKNYLSENNGISLNDGAAWGQIFPDMAQGGGAGSFAGSADDILARYEQAANTNARDIYTPDNYIEHLMINPEENEKYTKSLTNLLGDQGKIDIPVSQAPSNVETLEISGLKKPEKVVTVAESAPEAAAAQAQEPAQKTFTQSKADIGGDFNIGGNSVGGQSGNGGGRINISESPVSPEDYGFNQPLETNKNGDKVIKINSKAAQPTYRQKARNFDDRNWLDSMNATRAQYKDVFADKSRSINGYYKNAVERARANGLNQSNIKDRIQQMLDVRNVPLTNAEQYATDAGVRVNLPNLELSQAQAQSLSLAGVDLGAIQSTGTATPNEAEQIYKMLRNDGNRLRNAADGVSQEKGEAMMNMAKELSNSIDNTMDSLGLNYKDSVLQGAAAIGEDQKYLQEIANSKDYKFSDMRADMADLMNLKDISLNKMKAGKTFNIAGIDTGIPNPLGQAAEEAKSKYYNFRAGMEEKAAKTAGNGAGSSKGGKTTSSSSSAGNGNSGGNTKAGGYSFEAAAPENTSTLGNLLGKVKKVAPYAAAAGIGYMAGQGGDGDSSATNNMDMSALYSQGQQEQESDPYETETIGGYNMGQLEEGYARALAAGDTKAAEQIASLIDVLDSRVKRIVSASSKKNSGSSVALDAVNQLEQLYNQIGSGSTGVIQGNITSAGNLLTGGGYNTAASNYESMKSGMLGLILKKGLSESGALSDSDIQRAMNLLPNLNTNEKTARSQFQQLRQLLQTVAAQ